MTNIEKYNNAFVEVFGVEITVLNDEESLDIMFDPEDIMEFTSYGKGREILKKYDVEL